ncbi:tetratricopeptide repeat protein [Mycobacterium sp. HNNTM2301]|uniref:tetratricopeptide repeat protein n=1 Tax=Mycobacterium hainanense TaxID=3289775 RepID=UPI0035A58A47
MTSEPSVRADSALQLARAYYATKNYQRAQDVTRSALSQNPNDPDLLALNAAAEHALENHWVAAWSAYSALSTAPQHEFAMRVYALALYGLGRTYDALWMAWRGVTAHPNQAEQHRVYATLLAASRQFSSALFVVDRALQLESHSVDALILRGYILYRLGRVAESDAAYRQALQLDPGNAEALNDLAVHRLDSHKFGRALHGFLVAAGRDPALANLARRNIGVVLRKVLTGVTIGAGLVSVLLAITAGAYNDGRPTAVARVVVGLVTAALIAVLWWLLRAIPRGVLLSVLRKQHFSAARAIHALVAIAAGAWVTVYPGPPAMIAVGGLLAVIALIIIRIGLFIGK